MKRLLPFIFLFGWGVACPAQQSLELSESLIDTESHHFTATDHVLLAPGFKSEPKEGQQVTIELNPYDTSPPSIGIQGGPEPGDDGVVGALEGKIDVQGLGAATYTIPIEVPEGLGGMKPQLFIYYNNHIKNGLLGWNWDLGGLSAITRTGGTYYHDGYNSPVNYTTDRFCLDGQRLMKVVGNSYGMDGTIYHTEVDQMSKIVSFCETGIAGPSYFKVWTADGKICCYGSSQDSKALVDSENHVTTWLLKSIEDRNGNMIQYHYKNESDSYLLTRIDYSGNNTHQIAPCFSIEFKYKTRNDVEYAAHGSCFQKSDQLLYSILIKNKGATMYTYSFQYQEPIPQHGYYYHLLTSIGFAAENQHINPTRIEWSNNNYDLSLINQTKINVTTHSIENAFAHAAKFSGDFNGDGYSDVIAVKLQNGSHSNQAELFLNCGLSGNLVFDHVKTFNLSPTTNWVYVADFDGDGCDDVLFSNREFTAGPNLDIITSTIYLSRKDVFGNLVFNSHSIPPFLIRNDLFESLLIGDFFGDGRQSALIQVLEGEDKNAEHSVLIHYNDSSLEFQLSEFDEYLDATRFYTADYDGDGATEILYKRSNGYTSIAKLSEIGETYHYTNYYTGLPQQWDDCFPGDFNADGIADMLFYKPTESNAWFIQLSTQTGLDNTVHPLPSSFPYQNPGCYHYSLNNLNETDHFINIGDFDGNGCSDLLLKEGSDIHVYYGPINNSGNDGPFTNHRQISTQLFYYFSNLYQCSGNFLGKDNISFLGNYTLSHLPSMSQSHEVKQICDGMGRKIQLEYDYLMPTPKNPSESDFYCIQTPFACNRQKVYRTYIPLRALKKVTTYNVKDKPMTTECHYEGALLHRQGKGFLGFSKTSQKDYYNNQLQKRTTRYFDFQCEDPVIHLSMTSEEVHNRDGALVASTSYSNLIYTNYHNDRVFVPISHKTINEYDVDHPERLLKKEISEVSVETNCSQPFQYNNIMKVVQTIKGVTDNANIILAQHCEFQEKTITTYMGDITTQYEWLINRPQTITHIMHRNGNYEDICTKKVFTYNSTKLHLLKQVTEIPNDGSNPNDRLKTRTAFQYDVTGNIISKTVTAPNDSLPSRTESYTYGTIYGHRLVTEHTDAAGHKTKYLYHPVYNHCVSTIDCNHLETKLEQDPLGITAKTTHPDGTVTTKAIRWSGGDYYTWEKRTGMPTKIVQHSKTGEIVRKASYSLNGELTESTIEYDDLGRILRERSPYLNGKASSTVSYHYDSQNRIASIEHSNGTREYLHYDGRKTRSSYHSIGNQTQTESKTVNVMGWVVKSTDANGVSVLYDYYPDGKMKCTHIEDQEETMITMDYDGHGNRTLLYDPNYGLTSSEYNAFDELTRQVTPKLDITDFEYDLLGNKTKRTETCKKSNLASITEWQYGNEDGKYGILLKIKSENQTIDYEYDQYLRLSSINDHCFEKNYKTSYTYDQASRVASLTYPSNYTVHYCYTSEGQLRSVMDDTFNELWRAKGTNALGMPTCVTTGNGLITEYKYDPSINKLIKITTTSSNESIQDYEYEYDDFSNMVSRIDLKHNQCEQFSYDPLNRLTKAVDKNGESVYCYDALGRMTSKTKANQPVFTNAEFDAIRPHAVKTVLSPQNTFPQERMDLTYTNFGKVAQIQEGANRIYYQYGYDHQRIRLEENLDGGTREKIYANNCEFITRPDGSTATWTFLSSTTGVFAVAETVDGITTLHYIHKDHLGSWSMVTDSNGKAEQETSFDAWGECDNPDALLFDRGYSGHEHIRGMNLINMNGRIYDPVTSSMLSPDNYIQKPDFTQNFNRYSYCLNNPLSYTDPDGNSFVETTLLIYFIFFTDMGYEFQKYVSPIALHVDIHYSSQQQGIGLDVSVGFEKTCPVSYRMHFGATYYWKYYDDSYQGWEFRVGGEWSVNGCIGFSGTTFYTRGKQQTTNSIILGNFLASAIYENDYMFNIGKYLFGIPAADNGDRYRTAAARVNVGPISVGFNIFTGDPGHHKDSRRTFKDPENGKITYTLNEEGNDPDQYRAGILYLTVGPISVGRNSEQIRHWIQNRFAHDFLCQGDSPYFKVLDRPAKNYFYFGTGTGGTLW